MELQASQDAICGEQNRDKGYGITMLRAQIGRNMLHLKLLHRKEGCLPKAASLSLMTCHNPNKQSFKSLRMMKLTYCYLYTHRRKAFGPGNRLFAVDAAASAAARVAAGAGITAHLD